jgi:hypothetical protein
MQHGLLPGLVLGLMILAPGWALLFLTGRWRRLPPLQSWCLALFLGTALYPTLFYAARVSGVVLTRGRLVALVAGALVVAVVQWWHHRAQLRRLDQLEWCAVAVVALTIATRIILAIANPFPAWADSLHHCLITDLTTRHGTLPRTLVPYFDVDLGQYHLGVYALTGGFATLTGLPAHTALVWIIQWVSACGALGVYYVLDRHAGRVAAVAALVLVGLVLHQPAIYFNYGRVTHLTANLLLLPAWVETIHALRAWIREGGGRACSGPSLVAGLLCGAVALTHFRVTVLLALIIAPTVAWMMWQSLRVGGARRLGLGLAAVALVAGVVAAPAVIPAMAWHIAPRLASLHQVDGLGALWQPAASYAYAGYVTPAALDYWRGCWIVIGFGGVVALIRRATLGVAMLGWIALTVAFYAMQARHPAFDIMNPGFVMLMLYLPAGVLFGAAIHEAAPRAAAASRWTLVLMLVAAAAAVPTTLSIAEPYRFFVTRADERAMAWIRRETSPDAIFAVNTTSWVPGIVHGTDAGYFIPYFTGRRTTAGCLLPGQFRRAALQSEPVEGLQRGDDRIVDLITLGVTHIYIGAKGHYAGTGLDPARLRSHPELSVVYDRRGVVVLAIKGNTRPVARSSLITDQR